MINCWHKMADKRPTFDDVINFFANHDRIMKPCPDVPLASVDMDVEEEEVQSKKVRRRRRIWMWRRRRCRARR